MWFEGETLYSWAAHFHELQGRVSSRATGELLFGKDHVASRHSTLSGVAHFARVTRGELGSLVEIVLLHTPLGEIRPFVEPNYWSQIICSLSDSGTHKGIRPMTGLLPRAIAMQSKPRYCFECVKTELVEIGTSFWHLGHQFQCSFACAKHRTPLMQQVYCGTTWRLPHHFQQLNVLPTMSELALDHALLLTKLSEVCCQMDRVDLSVFACAAVMRLITMDIETIAPRECGDALRVWFSHTLSSQVIKAFYPNNSELASGTWIPSLLRSRRSGNSLYWLLLWGALLEGLPDENAIDIFRMSFKEGRFCGAVSESTAEIPRNMLYIFLRRRQRRLKPRRDVQLT